MKLPVLHVVLIPAMFFTSGGMKAQDLPELVVSSGHHQTIQSVNFSPDGRYIVSGGTDNLVKIYDLRMQQEFLTISDYSASVSQVEFSPDGKYVLSLADKDFFVHDHPSGKLKHHIVMGDPLSDHIFYCTKAGKIILGNSGSGVHVYDLESGQLDRILTEIEVNRFLISADEKSIIHQGSIDDGNQPGLQISSLEDGSSQGFVPLNQAFLTEMTLHPASNMVVWEYSMGKLALIDLKTLKVVREWNSEITGAANILEFSPDGKQLYLSGFDNVVRIWDISTGKKIQEIKDLTPTGEQYSMSMMISDLAFSPDGSVLAYGYLDFRENKAFYTVEWFNSKTMESIGRHFGDTKLSPRIVVDQTGTILCTGSLGKEMGTKFIDVVNGTQKQFVPGGAYFSAGGSRIATVEYREEKSYIDIFESPSLRLERSIENYGFAELTMAPSGRYLAAIDQNYNPNAKPGGEMVVPYVRVWECETGKEIVHIRRVMNDGLRTLLFSQDESELYMLSTGKIEAISLATGKVLREIAADFDVNNTVSLSPDGQKIVGAAYTETYAVDVNTGERKALLEEELVVYIAAAMSPDKRYLAVSVLAAGQEKPNRVRLYDWNTMSLLCEFIGHTNTVRNICIDRDSKHLYSVDDNGVIGMWDIPNCLLKTSFLAFGSEDYLFINPEGYYKSSKGNIANIGFRLKGRLYTFDQFDLRYNRPDIILKSIGLASEAQIALYEKAYHKRLRRMGFSEADFSTNLSAPDIEIVGLDALPLQVTTAEINLNWRANDANSKLDRLQVLVNDVPIYGKLGMDLKAKESKSIQDQVKIPLTSGTNKIQLAVMNEQGIESARVNYSVECKKPVVQPDLYVLAYGVRSFADSSMNLTYSDKDADDFTKLLQAASGKGTFKNVHVRLVQNKDVTRESLTESRAFLQQSKLDDQVVLFFSGHGLLSQDMDYFLSTYDVNFTQPELRGIAFDAFQDLMDNIPARNRILLVDACHSGEVDKDEVAHAQENDVAEVHEKSFAAKGKKVIGLGSSFELMKDLFVELRKEVGATVIASSSGKEFSLESADWKNGVFTFALKEALSQKKADANKDGQIQVSELKKYLAVRVKELTNGRQVPTARSENLQKDIIVY